ncbi:Protein kinase domain-containing protein [Mycena indigotica]|uniref:mitogen-activated protein kinase kinase n=1 Tax=Mycena indigotica TaxID=2126181 RepID=A0A8H6TDQ3_9AGAR|nr:Protein kinase domain-containing protein [Mycena indigotica]KAF7315788.1 Protein kinase domain-containing protein [Mycena indigotica]
MRSTCSLSADLPDLVGAIVDDGFFRLTELLDIGRFSRVYKAVSITDPDLPPCAIKCMRRVDSDAERFEELRSEIYLHARVADLPGVASFSRVFTEAPGTNDELVFLVLEFVPTNFERLILDINHFSDRFMVINRSFCELLDAIEACHSAQVFHCDIRPANVLCDTNGLNIRLTDFGLATEEPNACLGRGEAAYLTPEATSGLALSHSAQGADLWALAVLLFVLITGEVPWTRAHMDDPRYAAFRVDPDTFLQDEHLLSPVAASFFRRCFSISPILRPSLACMREMVLPIEVFSIASMVGPQSSADVVLAALGMTKSCDSSSLPPSLIRKTVPRQLLPSLGQALESLPEIEVSTPHTASPLLPPLRTRDIYASASLEALRRSVDPQPATPLLPLLDSRVFIWPTPGPKFTTTPRLPSPPPDTVVPSSFFSQLVGLESIPSLPNTDSLPPLAELLRDFSDDPPSVLPNTDGFPSLADLLSESSESDSDDVSSSASTDLTSPESTPPSSLPATHAASKQSLPPLTIPPPLKHVLLTDPSGGQRYCASGWAQDSQRRD